MTHQGDHPPPGHRRAGPRRGAGRRVAGVLVQPHRRPARVRQDHAGAPDHVRHRHARAPGAVLHRAGRAAAEDAALPAAVRLLRREAINRSIRFINLSRRRHGRRPRPGAAGASSRRSTRTARRSSSWTRSARWSFASEQPKATRRTSLQQFVQQLGMLLTSWQATTFLIGEYFNETDANPVFTVADGLIWLRQSVAAQLHGAQDAGHEDARPGDAAGAAHLPHHGPGSRCSHRPRQRPRPARLRRGRAPARALLTGVPRLDEMLGGGLPRGYSLLVAGPSGSGKSILAAVLPRRGRAPAARPASSPPSSSTRTGRATACSST